MTVEILALCDAATSASEGKLNILGAFDTINAKNFPAMHPHCAIAMRLRFSRLEEGEHRVRISIVDDDGKAIMPELEGRITVKVPGDDPSAVTNLVINIQQLRLAKAGGYSINLALDGSHVTSLPLMVKTVTG